MSYRILFDRSELVAGWISAQIPDAPELAGAVAFGAMRGEMLVGGIAFTEKRGPDIRVTVAGYGPWMTRRLLAVGFAFAYRDQDCARMTAIVKRTNKASRRLVEKLGFKLEGVHRRAFEDGGTACTYGLLRSECRWLPKPRQGTPADPSTMTEREGSPHG